jgi:hypothetical protein
MTDDNIDDWTLVHLQTSSNRICYVIGHIPEMSNKTCPKSNCDHHASWSQSRLIERRLSDVCDVYAQSKIFCNALKVCKSPLRKVSNFEGPGPIGSLRRKKTKGWVSPTLRNYLSMCMLETRLQIFHSIFTSSETESKSLAKCSQAEELPAFAVPHLLTL